MIKLLIKLHRGEKGQGMIEYGLILALVSIFAVTSLGGIGDKINNTFDSIVGGESTPISYTVTFKDNEGNDIESFEISKGDDVTAPDGPTVEGYTFIGWSGSLENITQDEIIIPEYEVNTYSVTFKDANGVVLGNASVNHGESVNAPNIPNVTDDMWDKPLDSVKSDGNITLRYGLVRTPQDLATVKDNLRGKYLQVADIDMSSYGKFEPIGNGDNKFTGTYDGGGYEIKNLHAYRYNYSGLFGQVSGARIKNVGLTNVIVGEAGYSGGLVGTAVRNTTIENSYVTGSVISSNGYEAHNGTGGMVGSLEDSTIINSYTITRVGDGSQAGGLVGILSGSSKIINSYAAGNVLGVTGSNDDWSSRGGLVGKMSGNATVTNSYFDRQTAGHNDSGKGVSRTTSQMKTQGTFSTWNFDTIWKIDAGQYPTLR